MWEENPTVAVLLSCRPLCDQSTIETTDFVDFVVPGNSCSKAQALHQLPQGGD